MSERIIHGLLKLGFVLFLVALYHGWTTWSINGRPLVEAQVLSVVEASRTVTRVGRTGPSSNRERGVVFTFSFELDGRSHRAKLFDTGWRGVNAYVSFEELKKAHPPGSAAQLLVNPADPRDVRFHGASWEGFLVWLALAAAAVASAFLLGWGTTKEGPVEDITRPTG